MWGGHAGPRKRGVPTPAADSAFPPSPPPPPPLLPPKLMGTKDAEKVSSYKNRRGTIKNKDQGFRFSMTLAQGRGHHAYLARSPSPVPSGKQEPVICAWQCLPPLGRPRRRCAPWTSEPIFLFQGHSAAPIPSVSLKSGSGAREPTQRTPDRHQGAGVKGQEGRR